MRTYEYSYRDALVNGLRPDVRVQSHARYLAECYGVKPSQFGLIKPDVITFPIEGYTAGGYSQFIDGDSPFLFDYADSVCKLYTVSSTYTLSSDLLSSGKLQDAYDKVAAVSILATNNHVFDRIEVDTFFIMTNSDSCIIDTGLHGEKVAINHSTNKIPSSVCKVGKQLIFGGFNGAATYWTGAGQIGTSLWAQLRQYGEGFRTTYLDDKTLVYGRQDSLAGDYPFTPEVILLTGYQFSTYQEAIKAFIRSGAIGARQIPWEGGILRVKELGRYAVVYGDKGIGIFDGASSTITQVADFGLANRDAIAGDAGSHVFLNNKGELWKFNGDLSKVKLGYEEYLGSMLTAKLCYAGSDGDWYITGSNCYSYTNEGKFYQSYYKPTSLLTSGADLYGVATVGSAGAYFKTHETGFRRRAHKRINAIELQQSGCTNLVGTIYARVGSTTYSLGEIRFNQEDVGWAICSGTDFQFKIACDISTLGTIDDIQIKWQSSDGRTVRGLVEAPNEQG